MGNSYGMGEARVLRVRSRERALALHKLGNLDGNASASCLEVLPCIKA